MTFESLRHDLHLAWRGLWRAKAFCGAAVCTLALGIAGTIVIFTLIQGVLLRPMPVRDQDRLIVAWKELRSSGYAHHPFGDAEIDAAGDASRLLESVAGVTSNGAFRWIAEEGASRTTSWARWSPGAFSTSSASSHSSAASLTRADDKAGAEDVLVISHGLWQRRYGGSHEVIGRRITLSERPFTIVGVMPPDVAYPSGIEVWRTTRSVPGVPPSATPRSAKSI